MFIHNDPKLKLRRKDLRNSATKEEKFLWLNLRNNKLGYKFTRQYSFGPYIFDFYCTKAKLAIELDGLQHKNNKEYDKERDSFAEMQGITVLRFWNSEVINDIENVIKKIKVCLEVIS